MLNAILNISGKEHPTKISLYGNIPPLTRTVLKRITRLACHCYLSEEEIINQVFLWTPNH